MHVRVNVLVCEGMCERECCVSVHVSVCVLYFGSQRNKWITMWVLGNELRLSVL